MMNPQLRTLLDLMLVLALGAWACRFLWLRYGQSRGRQNKACANCEKCGH